TGVPGHWRGRNCGETAQLRGIIVDRIVRQSMTICGVLVGLLMLAQSPAEAASRTSLSFPCRYAQRMVICTLTGHHFYPRERVRIVYTVFASPAQGAKAVGVYRRMTLTGAQGSFTRPAFWAYFDPRN